MSEEIVIARYNESLDWVEKIKQPFIVYNKGEKLDGIVCVEVDNVGREGDTWLRHIIMNYYELADVTYFLQGNPIEHLGIVIEFLGSNIKCEKYLSLGAIIKNNHYGKPHHPRRIRVGKTYKKIFEKDKKIFDFSAGAQYAVHKSCIQNKSLEWWDNLFTIYHTTRNAAWIFERLWPDIWEYKMITK